MVQQFLDLVDIAKAKNLIGKFFRELYYPPQVEKVRLQEAYGRILAHDIKSPIDLPPFDRALRDGYAVRAEDTFHADEDNPIKLKCVEIIEAGSKPQEKVKRGCCARISTGAPIPEGADAVVMVEYTQEDGNNIMVYRSAYPNQHIAMEGSDISRGDIIAAEGSLLSPDKIGVLSAVGIPEVPVIAKLKVGIISTGDELIELGAELDYGKIFDSNSNSLAAAVESCGCEAKILGIVEDKYNELYKAIKKGLGTCDLLIISGGTSAGAGDILAEVIDEIGELIIHGISIKPGKPTIVGKVNDKLLFGLPGFPVSALIVFNVLLTPYLREFSGKPLKPHSSISLPLAQRLHSSKGRVHYALIKIEDGKAYPIFKDSGAVGALAKSDGYTRISKNVEILEEGSILKVFPFSEASNNAN